MESNVGLGFPSGLWNHAMSTIQRPDEEGELKEEPVADEWTLRVLRLPVLLPALLVDFDVVFDANQYVWSSPLPFAWILSVLLAIRCPKSCFSVSNAAVSELIWIRPFIPLLSIRAAVLTVSPNNWNRARSPRSTPAVTGPLCSPTRICKLQVSSPNLACNVRVNATIFWRESRANLAMFNACVSHGSGNPQTVVVKKRVKNRRRYVVYLG
mmetsp:Transcript_33157/g.80498  ORF Transcript_33157/g.80498 Transcript_33157/m.80498 type:complete len:211 (-) Transcript_33157:12-644(-)